MSFRVDLIRTMACAWACLAWALAVPNADAAVNLASFSDDLISGERIWTAYPSNAYDYNTDSRTGQAAADIIGTFDDPGFYTAFDGNGDTSLTDGFLAFRVRTNSQNGTKDYFGGYIWVGIDIEGDGDTDVFINYTSGNNTETVSIYGPGTGSNTSPSTSTVTAPDETNGTYVFNNLGYSAYRAVVSGAGFDGGTTNNAGNFGPTPDTNPDWYASFQIPFDALVAFLGDTNNMPNGTFAIDDTDLANFKYTIATSTNPNSFNQDIGGVDGYFPDNDWVFVPEPSSSLLLMLGGIGLLLRRRRA